MHNNIKLMVISHTHWDREWYMPLEQFRIRLVDLIDNLLGILEQYPQYIFHLDAQTIVLEDYLEIRPYRRGILDNHIREGRILVGPWYVQNDFYLTSGEATIRNLLIGSRIAEEFGKCAQVGYAPDQFGVISQIPQILNGFGIDSCIFGRGYNFFEKAGDELKPVKTRSELIWEGDDGSRVLAIHMPFWYNNAQRFSEDIDKSMKYLTLIEKSFEGVAQTPYLLLMNGVDHLEAQENLLPILEQLNQRLPEGRKIEQTTMQVYADQVREYLDQSGRMDQLTVYRGEMRNGIDYNVLQGTLSSRIYLKVENVKAQNLLECRLEPVYSFISMLGAAEKYPEDHLRYLWKLLLQNHPHDSICGCSRDEVHNHMEDRYAKIQEAGDMLLERGMEFISTHVTREGLGDSRYLLTLFNTVEGRRSGVVGVELQFPAEEKVSNFTLVGPDGKEVPFLVLENRRKSRGMWSPINLPGSIEVDAYRIQFYLEDMEGLSYRTLIVNPVEGSLAIHPQFTKDAPGKTCLMENDALLVTIHANGKIDLLNKETGTLYEDILMLEDREDCGDSYVYASAPNGKTFTSREMTPSITCIGNTALESIYRLEFMWALPERFDFQVKERSEVLVPNRIAVDLRLHKGSKWLEMSFEIDNNSKDHRLRALIACPFVNDLTHASTPFDIIRRDRRDLLKGISNGTQPNSGFISLDGDREGVAVLGEGAHEYESLLGDRGTIALTLLRATGYIFGADDGILPMDEAWRIPGNQCCRKINVRLGIYPYSGDYLAAEAALKAKEFQNPPLVYFQPADPKKFAGGRPAVQDSEIKEIFFRPDAYAHLVLPRERKFVDIGGKGILLSALKKSEKEDGLILRVYNTEAKSVPFELNLFKPIAQAFRTNLKEEPLERLAFDETRLKPFLLKPKEIVTLAITCK